MRIAEFSQRILFQKMFFLECADNRIKSLANGTRLESCLSLRIDVVRTSTSKLVGSYERLERLICRLG